MSVNTWSLKQRIKELTNENNELRRKRAELEEKVAAREEKMLSPNPKPSQSADSGIAVQHQSDDEPMQPSSPLKQCLGMAQDRGSGLEFSNEQREILGDWEKYEANGIVGSVVFHIKFSWNELLLKSNGIEISFTDVFHKLELGPWLGICIRKNNVQKAIESIVQYSELLSEREEILEQMSHVYESNFRSEKSLAKRLYILEIFDSDCKYLDAFWAIKWDKTLGSMCHSFTFDIAKTPEARAMAVEQKHVLKGLLSMDRSIDDIKTYLIRLIESFSRRPQDSH